MSSTGMSICLYQDKKRISSRGKEFPIKNLQVKYFRGGVQEKLSVIKFTVR